MRFSNVFEIIYYFKDPEQYENIVCYISLFCPRLHSLHLITFAQFESNFIYLWIVKPLFNIFFVLAF